MTEETHEEEAPPSSASPPQDASSVPLAQGGSYTFLIVVTVVNLAADLWSKGWAKTHFESVRSVADRKVVVIEGVMNFIFAKNKGGAWGLFQNEDEVLRRAFFISVSVAAIVFIVSLYRKLQPGQTALKWGLPLVLGGALGNLVDRIRYGWVVDFIDVYVDIAKDSFWLFLWTPGPHHWPTFNVADIAICVGVGLMAIDMFSSRKKATDGEEDPEGEDGPASSVGEPDSARAAPDPATRAAGVAPGGEDPSSM